MCATNWLKTDLIWRKTPRRCQFWPCPEFILGPCVPPPCPPAQVTAGSDKWGLWLCGLHRDNSQAGTAGSPLILQSCFLSPTHPVTAGCGRQAGGMTFATTGTGMGEREGFEGLSTLLPREEVLDSFGARLGAHPALSLEKGRRCLSCFPTFIYGFQ